MFYRKANAEITAEQINSYMRHRNWCNMRDTTPCDCGLVPLLEEIYAALPAETLKPKSPALPEKP